MERKGFVLLLALVVLAHSLTLDMPAAHQMVTVTHQAKLESPCEDGEEIVPNKVPSKMNGCGSKPWHVKMGKILSPYLKHLNKCCNVHDSCFDTCAVSNWKSAFNKCNTDFRDCMYNVCKQKGSNYFSRKLCKANAYTFYQAVNKMGQGPWNSAQQSHCDCN